MSELEKIINNIEVEINKSCTKYPLRSKQNKSAKRTCHSLLIMWYFEVLIILKRIEKYKNDIHKNSAQEISLDIKILYNWFFYIYEVLRKNKINIKLLQEMERMTLIRNFIVSQHFIDKKFYKNKPQFFPVQLCSNDKGIRLMFFDSKPNSWSRLIKKCRKIYPSLNDAECPQKLQELYENANNIDKDLRKKVYEIIQEFGIQSETPEKIAETLLDAFKEYRKLKSV